MLIVRFCAEVLTHSVVYVGETSRLVRSFRKQLEACGHCYSPSGAGGMPDARGDNPIDGDCHCELLKRPSVAAGNPGRAVRRAIARLVHQ